jgi:hypothetical protein
VGYREWSENRGFKMAKLFPAEAESAVAELYFGDLVWAYVTLQGVNEAATGAARVRDARVVVEFWRDPDKPTGGWDFILDLAGAIEQLQRAQEWLIENETGRTPSSDEGVSAAGSAFSRMSEAEQRRWSGGGEEPIKSD